MCWFNHSYGRPFREPMGDQDYQACLNCGRTRVCPIQFGHWRPGVSSSAILTEKLEAEVLEEQANIRRRENFWL